MILIVVCFELLEPVITVKNSELMRINILVKQSVYNPSFAK